MEPTGSNPPRKTKTIGSCRETEHRRMLCLRGKLILMETSAHYSLRQNPVIYLTLSRQRRHLVFVSYIFSAPNMALSPSASLLLLYNSALRDYTTQTGTNLVDHPFAKQLEKCESVESISSLLHESARRFHESRKEDGKMMKSLKCAVHVLHTLSTSTILSEGIGLVRLMAVIPVLYP